MGELPRVIVAPYPRRMARVFRDEDLARLRGVADLVWCRDEEMPEEALYEALPEAVALVHGSWPYGGDEVLERAPRLRAVLEVLGGHSRPTFPYDYCFGRGIRVLSCSPAFAPQVAEMALGLAIAATRGIAQGDRLFRTGQEVYQMAGNEGSFLLYNKPVGLVGFGALGRALLPLLGPFRVSVSAYDPWLPDAVLREAGCTPRALDDLLATSRVLFVLAAPTTENRGLLSRERLALMPEGAVLVLISRAHLVDFDALTDLVLAGRIRAAIDVFPEEPLPQDHPIRRAEGAVLSAHRAGSTQEGHWEIGRMVVDDLEMILRGLPPRVMLRAEPELVPRTVVRR